VLLLVAVLLAVFVLPSPWGLVGIAFAALVEIAEAGAFIWWSQRRKASVGVEMLVGKRGVAVDALWPKGQVRVNGELWEARCQGGCDPGSAVVVRGIDGLVLEVDSA
jgi:membrane-bound serine protease (ClpP class)